MLKATRALLAAALLAASALGSSAWALSGNAQLALASAGKFDELATGVEAMVGKEPMRAADWHALCYAYSRTKRYGQILVCLDELDKAMAGKDKRTRLFGLDDGTATSFVMRAEALVELADYPAAVVQANKALEWYAREKSDDKDIFINASAAKCLALLASGQRPEAEKVAVALDNFQLGLLGKEFVPVKSVAMARTNMALGHWQKVLDALADDKTIGLRSFFDNLASGAYLRGVNNWVWIELPRALMQTKAQMELGRIDEAKAGYDKLLAVPQIVANGEIYWLALYDRGRIAVQQGELPLAEKLFQNAAAVIERQRLTIHSEANKIGFVGDKQAVYAQLVAVQFKQLQYARAFESMERGKSRALVDMLASRQAPSGLLAAKSSQGVAVNQVLQRLQQAELDSHRQDETRIAGALQPKADTSKSIAKELPGKLAALVSVDQLDAREAQALIGADEALLVYFQEGKRLYATLVQTGSVHGAEIDASRLDADIRQLREGLQAGHESTAVQLQALYKALVAPLAPFIKGTRLTVVPHGALHYLPFAALNDGQRDLIDQYTVRMLPSVAVLKFLRPSTAQDASAQGLARMLVMGNPDLGNPQYDLPGAELEAKALAVQLKPDQLLLRKQATRAAFQELAPKARYIHVASHGEFDASRPLQSGLILAADKPGGGIAAGRLTVSDLYALQLDAELVTLSACETGLGQVASGDDVVGLTRGFLYAGASTVVASLWQVDDDATAFLMQRMYTHIVQGNRRDALRKAQQETRAKFPHPRNWAAFYLTGFN